MRETGKEVLSLGLGIATVCVILFFAWSAVCMVHSGEQGFTAHCVMGVLSALILLPMLFIGFRNLRTS